MKKRVLSLMLAAALVLGLAVPAMAYTTPDFSDVPSNHWAYESVMKMADAGVIKGTGGGMFSPEMKLSAEMFIVLVGRVVFPDVKAEGADWSGPYVTEAKAKGLLEGTNITDSNLKGDISRYDMAVILAKCVDLLKVSATKADSSKVTDYGEVPTKYVDAVLTVYGAGLIKGDQAGNFNGANSMTRQEAATVMDRLLALIPGGSTVTPDTDPEKPVDPRPETIHTAYYIRCITPEQFSENKQGERTLSAVPLQFRYTEDGGKTSRLIAECTSYNTDGFDYVNLSLDVEKALVDNENGQFYFSGETEYNGQRLVTQDLRTDGRATIIPVKLEPLGRVKFHDAEVEMVPPTGFKRNIAIRGSVHANTFDAALMPNIAVDFKLYRDTTGEIPGPDDVGIVMGSTVTDKDGAFRIETTLDTLDWILSTKCYRLEAHGMYEGKEWVTEPWMQFMSLNEITSLEEWRLPRVWIEMKPV